MTQPSGMDADRLLAELDALLGPGPAPPTLLPPAPMAAPPPAAGRDGRPLPAAGSTVFSAARGAQESRFSDAGVEPAAAGHKARKVLIVDDNKDYRDVVRYVLAETGYEVMEARDGAEGLESAIKAPPDLVVLDFDMPKLNGFELIQDLRSREETRRLPVIMLTGAQKRRHLKEMRLDISEFLEKPVSNADLLSAVARVLHPPDEIQGPTAPPQAAPSANGVRRAAEPEQQPAPSKSEPPELAKPKSEPSAPTPMLDLFDTSASEGELLIEEQKKEPEEEHYGLDVLSNDSPLVNRINRILITGVDMGASDIHIEPEEKQVLVRVRINGSLQPLCHLPAALSAQLAARVKVISNLIITERRRPQDGQFRAMIKGKKIEFRVSTIPSIHGEKIVLRVLGQSKIKSSLAEMGLSPHDLEAVEWAMENPHGLILVTGPTGSGKTTTLYTVIRLLNKPDVNIMTAEDPVEYELPGITQVHVKPQLQLTFEAVLRSFLRQDPDIMLVGEIRDLETAEIAVKASITGHLVLSTVHTNSAAATVMRLSHMGVAPFLLSDSLKLIVAQRLLRTLCSKCKQEVPVSDDIKRHLSSEEMERISRVYESRGCQACRQTGFEGRMAVYEVMPIRTRELKQLILAQQSVDKIAEQAVKEGMTPLRQAALNAVAEGKTSFAEALQIMFGE